MSGFRRFRDLRKARIMFIKAFSGQYYNRDHGKLGAEPLNMSFTAVRALVPNLVSRNPKNIVGSDYLAYRQYGELLAMGLDYLSKKLNLSEKLQRGIVDSIFTWGIFKVGLKTSGSLVYFGEEGVDPGKLYVDTVDFDDFTMDPTARQVEKATFLGEKIRVDRNEIMASGLYDNSVIERLPSAAFTDLNGRKRTRDLSAGQRDVRQANRLHDYIDLLELWLPGPNVVVTLPYKSSVSGKFLREETFYGPDDGPYAFLSLTPPVPDNPVPVQLAGIWHDLHVIGNRIAKKTLDQAEAQKDILGYQSQSADAAQEVVDAKNLEAIKMDDPQGVQMFSVGGQNPSNERIMPQLLEWFNQFSGNTSLLGGTNVQTNVATVANIMNQNAGTGVTYMRDQVYNTTKKIMRKLAWYLHTDPLIRLPLIHRAIIPAEWDITEESVRMISPPRTQETQVFLTPEVRAGDFLDFAFNIEQESMAPINGQVQQQQMETLFIKIIPAAAQATQIALQMGVPMSFSRAITHIAKSMNIDWMDSIFQDPEAIALMARMAQQGPQPQNSKGIASAGAVRQNGGSVTAKVSPAPQTRQRQEAQSGANRSQAELPVRER